MFIRNFKAEFYILKHKKVWIYYLLILIISFAVCAAFKEAYKLSLAETGPRYFTEQDIISIKENAAREDVIADPYLAAAETALKYGFSSESWQYDTVLSYYLARNTELAKRIGVTETDLKLILKEEDYQTALAVVLIPYYTFRSESGSMVFDWPLLNYYRMCQERSIVPDKGDWRLETLRVIAANRETLDNYYKSGTVTGLNQGLANELKNQTDLLEYSLINDIEPAKRYGVRQMLAEGYAYLAVLLVFCILAVNVFSQEASEGLELWEDLLPCSRLTRFLSKFTVLIVCGTGMIIISYAASCMCALLLFGPAELIEKVPVKTAEGIKTVSGILYYLPIWLTGIIELVFISLLICAVFDIFRSGVFTEILAVMHVLLLAVVTIFPDRFLTFIFVKYAGSVSADFRHFLMSGNVHPLSDPFEAGILTGIWAILLLAVIVFFRLRRTNE